MTLGTPSEAGCGLGVVIGIVLGGLGLRFSMPAPTDRACGLWFIAALSLFAFCVLLGGLCGGAGAFLRRAPLGALCGAAIAWFPLLIGRLSVAPPHGWRLSEIEIAALAIGALAGLAGGVFGSRIDSSRLEGARESTAPSRPPSDRRFSAMRAISIASAFLLALAPATILLEWEDHFGLILAFTIAIAAIGRAAFAAYRWRQRSQRIAVPGRLVARRQAR